MPVHPAGVRRGLHHVFFGFDGRPKGITHSHASGLSYSRLSIKTYRVSTDDVIANHSPISFDMSTFGYFTSFLAGATTVLVPEATTKFPADLAQLIQDEGVTIWYSVPLALIQLLTRTELDRFQMASLRWVKFGGEPFSPRHLKALMKIWPHARFSNVYGPAEVNQCTYYHVPAEFADDSTNDPLPIGKIWDDTEGQIIDADGTVVEDGQVGELVVKSPTMMMGYWGQPERTAQAMWTGERGSPHDAAFYRTGDLVQIRDDGNLLFHGRCDRQVKIRGYRIELDEVEHALNAMPDVSEAGVYCIQRAGEEREIHASVIPSDVNRQTTEGIRGYLASVLSAYAIPTQITLVDSLPRTTSGKIDRNYLAQEACGATNS